MKINCEKILYVELADRYFKVATTTSKLNKRPSIAMVNDYQGNLHQEVGTIKIMKWKVGEVIK